MNDTPEIKQGEEINEPIKKVVKELDMLAYKAKKQEKDSGVTVARSIGPTWNAFISEQPDFIKAPEEAAARRLLALKETLLRGAQRALDQNVYNDLSELPRTDKLEVAFRRELRDEWDLHIRPNEQSALTKAADSESRRQKIRNKKPSGMSLSIRIDEKKMVGDTLWSIRDL